MQTDCLSFIDYLHLRRRKHKSSPENASSQQSSIHNLNITSDLSLLVREWNWTLQCFCPQQTIRLLIFHADYSVEGELACFSRLRVSQGETLLPGGLGLAPLHFHAAFHLQNCIFRELHGGSALWVTDHFTVTESRLPVFSTTFPVVSSLYLKDKLSKNKNSYFLLPPESICEIFQWKVWTLTCCWH